MKTKKILLILLAFLIFLIGGVFIIANAVLNKMNYTDWSDTKYLKETDILTEEENTENLQEIDSSDVVFENNYDLTNLPEVSNILLIGEENVYEDTRGRTDSMMILSINTKTKSLKLISLMRDSYVQIPGYQDNRLNAAYALGGVPLLKETIETNFGIQLDNTALVNFDAFESIIDILGGVDIEITEEECEYLNQTNYISKEENRTLVPGLNHLNGNQALGYSRIRYVKGINGESADFGRTNRHRTLLNALYKEYKSSDLTTLMKLMNEILPYITTDISHMEAMNYVMAVLTMSPDSIETLRLPIDEGYNSVSIRKMAVLQLDMDKNREALQEFLMK